MIRSVIVYEDMLMILCYKKERGTITCSESFVL